MAQPRQVLPGQFHQLPAAARSANSSCVPAPRPTTRSSIASPGIAAARDRHPDDVRRIESSPHDGLRPPRSVHGIHGALPQDAGAQPERDARSVGALLRRGGAVRHPATRSRDRDREMVYAAAPVMGPPSGSRCWPLACYAQRSNAPGPAIEHCRCMDEGECRGAAIARTCFTREDACRLLHLSRGFPRCVCKSTPFRFLPAVPP